MKIKITVLNLLLLVFLAVALIAVALNFDFLANEVKATIGSSETPSPSSPQTRPQNSNTKPGFPTQPQLTIPSQQSVVDANDAQVLQESLNDFYAAKDADDREISLMMIGDFADPKAKEALLYALNDPEDSLREQAVSQIGNWDNDKEREQMLLAALSNSNPEVQILALESITEIDNPALLQKVKDLSADLNEDVSEAATNALEMIEEE